MTRVLLSAALVVFAAPARAFVADAGALLAQAAAAPGTPAPAARPATAPFSTPLYAFVGPADLTRVGGRGYDHYEAAGLALFVEVSHEGPRPENRSRYPEYALWTETVDGRTMRLATFRDEKGAFKLVAAMDLYPSGMGYPVRLGVEATAQTAAARARALAAVRSFRMTPLGAKPNP